MGDQTTAFVKQYQANIRLLAQQKGTKLRGTVEVDSDFVGEFKFYDQLGASEMTERVGRHADTALSEPDHKRRKITKRDYDLGFLLDQEDQMCMIADPKGKYSLTSAYAAGRKIDSVLIAAMGGTSYSGKEGATPETFDADMQIAAGGAGLTKIKLLEAKTKLDNNDIDDEDRHIAIAPKQLENLLGTVEVTSSDYNTVKALVDGQLNTWLGFMFHKTTRLVKTGDNRACYVWHRWAIQLAIQKEPSARADQRVDKSMAWQIFSTMSIGATRLEEDRIVEISCDESV